MVNVDKIQQRRSSRSRTPARVSTPQAKSKVVSKKTTTNSARKDSVSKSAKTPKTKATVSGRKSQKSATKVHRKRKSIVLKDDSFLDDDDEWSDPEYRTKGSTSKAVKKSPIDRVRSAEISRRKRKTPESKREEDPIASPIRRSKRIREQASLLSILELSENRDSSINGSLNLSEGSHNSRNESQRVEDNKWSWFSCAIM